MFNKNKQGHGGHGNDCCDLRGITLLLASIDHTLKELLKLATPHKATNVTISTKSEPV
jgi:hypothetical protein